MNIGNHGLVTDRQIVVFIDLIIHPRHYPDPPLRTYLNACIRSIRQNGIDHRTVIHGVPFHIERERTAL